MTESILDRLDREHGGGARQYVATLIVLGGASRAQVAEALARKYSIPEPTGRSVTAWKNGDSKLRAIIEAMQSAKRDLAPDDDLGDVLAKMPEPVDRGEAATDLFGVMEQFPAFNALSVRCFNDPDFPDDVWLKVLREDHDSDAAFEAACAALVGDYDPMTAAVEDHFAKHHERHSYADA
jgi:hypothetical protein